MAATPELAPIDGAPASVESGSRTSIWARVLGARAFDVSIAALLALGYTALLLATVSNLGYARDEGFYFVSAQSYERWFELLWEDPSAALEQSSVDRYWSANHEHPALMKSLFALSHHFLYEAWGWFSTPGTAYRFPGMLMGGLAVAVLYLWGRVAIGRFAGLVAALLFALMPRIFYHAHLDCFDVPVASMWLVTAYVYFRALTQGGFKWVVLAGLFYGLLLNTKHNSWLMPGALVVHFFLAHSPGIWANRQSESQAGSVQGPGKSGRGFGWLGRLRLPWAWLSMATLGPLVFYATWPWIWNDTFERFADYVAFHTGHEYYNMEFLGRTYWKPPMPLGYAWVMTLATVPGITLVLFGLGSVAAGGHALRYRLLPGSGWVIRRLHRLDERFPAQVPDDQARERYSTEVFWILCLLISYAPWLSNQTPIFGGTKHWITAYPFMALLAARGFWWVSSALAAGVQSRFGADRFSRFGVPLLVGVCSLSGPALMTLNSHPWGLSAYTPLVGGAPGAANLGLNRTFWGYTTGTVEEFINQVVPEHGRVYVHDTALQSFKLMQQDGRIRSDIRPTLNIASSHVALYHHEPHMGRVEYQIWVAYKTLIPALIRTHDGVPVIWVYARPEVLKAAEARNREN